MARREIPMSELGINPNLIADDSPPVLDDWIYLYGNEIWEGWLHEATREGRCECPVCRDSPGKWEYCLHCDHTGQDGRREFPGEPIGSRINADYHAEPTAYRPDGKLRGGKR